MFKHIRRRLGFAWAIILLTLAPLPAHAAENDGLAANFGGFGIGGVVASVPFAINKIALQPDGKVIAIGVRENTFVTARYTSDGQIDTSFGASGIVATTIAPGQQDAWASDVAIQPDGKIVVVGTLTTPGDRDFAVVRYNTDGTLDNSFSDNGILYAGFENKDDFGSAVAIDSNNRIIVGGTATIGDDDDFAVMSLTPNGLFDPSFGGGDGRATIGFGDDENAKDLVIQPDGRIVLGGRKYVSDIFGWHTEFAVARFNPDGSPDTTFDSDGKRSIDLSGGDFGESVALDTHGRIIITGSDFEFARLYPSGALDPNFDGDGKLSTPVSRNTWSSTVLALPDDKILAAGSIGGQMALLRYNFDGTLDARFDGDGKLLLDILPDISEAADSMLRMPDSRLLLAGGNVIVRLFADGTLDSGGRQLAAPASGSQDNLHIVQATLAQPDGAIVSVGLAHRGGMDDDIVLTRHLPNGLPDPTFGSNGARVFGFGATSENSQDALLQPDGKIVVVGTSRVDFQTDTNLMLARFRPDGSPDSSCGPFGIVIKDLFSNSIDTANSVAIQPADGKILVAGAVASNAGITPYVARFNADCGLDSSFSADGIALLGFGSSVADVIALPDGKVLLAGSEANTAYLARYTADGMLDTTFGGDGIITTLIGAGSTIQAAAIQPSTGKILLAGAVSNQGQYDFLLMRYNVDGTIDSGFGVDGRTISDMGDSEYLLALAVRDDGEIALAGCTTVTGLAVVALYTPAGVRDIALTGDGISTFRAGGFTCIKDAVFNNGRLIVGGHAGHDTALSFALGMYSLARSADGGTTRALDFAAVAGDDATFAEDARSAMLTVSLSQTAAQTVTVQYAPTGGTATNGVDYRLAAGTLTFAPGQTSQRIGVTLLRDAVDEQDETVIVTLSSPTNAILGSDISATLTITNAEAVNYQGFIPLVQR